MRLIVRLAGAVALAAAAWLIEDLDRARTTSERPSPCSPWRSSSGWSIIRPIVRLDSVPLFILTLGLFTVVNA